MREFFTFKIHAYIVEGKKKMCRRKNNFGYLIIMEGIGKKMSIHVHIRHI